MISCPSVSEHKKQRSPFNSVIFFLVLLTQSLAKLLKLLFWRVNSIICTRNRALFESGYNTLQPGKEWLWGQRSSTILRHTQHSVHTPHWTECHARLTVSEHEKDLFFSTLRYDRGKWGIARGPPSSINEDHIEKDYSDIVICRRIF